VENIVRNKIKILKSSEIVNLTLLEEELINLGNKIIKETCDISGNLVL